MAQVDVNKVIQLGIVVDDAERIADNYVELFGVNREAIMFLDTRELAGDWKNTEYMGKPVKFDLKIALISRAGIQFELIEPVGGDDNPYSDFLKNNGGGLHHVFIAFDNYEESVKALFDKKIPILTSGELLGGAYKYFDLTKELGLIVETAEVPDDYVESIVTS